MPYEFKMPSFAKQMLLDVCCSFFFFFCRSLNVLVNFIEGYVMNGQLEELLLGAMGTSLYG